MYSLISINWKVDVDQIRVIKAFKSKGSEGWKH